MTAREDYIGTTNSATGGEAVTPSDSVELTYVSRALWVGQAGDVTVKMRRGMNLTFANVPAGTLLPVEARMVLDTGTDSGLDIVALY